MFLGKLIGIFTVAVHEHVGDRSRIFVNGGLDHFGGLLPLFDQGLDVLNGLGGKKLLPSLPAAERGRTKLSIGKGQREE